MGYRTDEPGLWRSAFRGIVISLFAIFALAQCGLVALGETFNDPAGNATKSGALWGSIIGTLVGGFLVVWGSHKGIRTCAGAGLASVAVLVGSALLGSRIALLFV